MPATGLKIVGMVACLPWCSISSSFQNSLKTSGHRGYEFLEFCCWNLFPFPGFQLLKSSWSSLTYFSFNDAPNVLYRWKIWTAGRPIQHPDSSTTKPCCCNSCSMWFYIVLLKYTRFLEVFLGPFSNVNDRIMPMSDAVSSEGLKTTGIQQRSSALSLTHRDFSSFSESFDDVMHCRWWDLQSLCNLTLRNAVFKVFHNVFTHSFKDWRASAHLYFWETLPL